MERQLLDRFKQELRWLRSRMALFAADHPDAAARLGITADGCSDPHTERLLGSVALLSAGAQRSIDSAFPNVTTQILHGFEPQSSPVSPAMVMCRLSATVEAPAGGLTIPRGTVFQASVRGAPESSTFTSCEPVDLRPLEITASTEHEQDVGRFGLPIRARHVIRLAVGVIGECELRELGLDELVIHCLGESGGMVHGALLSPQTRVFARRASGGPWHEISIGIPRLSPAISTGTEDPVGRLDALARECIGLPERFRAVRLTGLGDVCRGCAERSIEIAAVIDRPIVDRGGPSELQCALHCVPLANVYSKQVEVRADTDSAAIVIDPARPGRFDVLTVGEVRVLDGDRTPVEPFGTTSATSSPVRFHIERRARWDGSASRGGSDIRLRFVDTDGAKASLGSQKLTVRTLVTDGEVVESMATAGTPSIEVPGSIPAARAEAVGPLRTASARALDGVETWSQAARAHAQIAAEGVPGLVRWLCGIDSEGSTTARDLARGIAGVRIRPVRSVASAGVSHGLDVTLNLGPPASRDDGSAVMLGWLVHRALASRSSSNTFLRTTTHLDDGEILRFADEPGQNPTI